MQNLYTALFFGDLTLFDSIQIFGGI